MKSLSWAVRPQLLLLFLAAFDCATQGYSVAAPVLPGYDSGSPRAALELAGQWFFQRDRSPSNEWKTVRVPSSFQSHEGTNFHGVGWYRKDIEPIRLRPGRRVLLHFQAAATETEVWWDGHRVGTHLGGWTPFRFDITDLIRASGAGHAHELKVRVDEKVGHNTQGFLPTIETHFGGLWQNVELLFVPETYVDDLQILARGDPVSGELRLEFPLKGRTSRQAEVSLRCRLRGEEPWTELAASCEFSNRVISLRARLPGARLWSPATPTLYEVEAALLGKTSDRVRTRLAFRSLTAFGPEIRLNGNPLQIRGLLNWGYSPPLFEPNPGEAAWRSEFEFARSRGFNLMKFCLWIPPARCLELADELGILAWIEYPTWHPTLTEQFREPLYREFREFFQYDRNHPAIVLRSLTCETGPSADLKLIQGLYDMAHQLIPGALVEDDSSWISWNRVHDFYDDHPYGNNRTWVKTLTDLNGYILGHGLKPLMLGESTAADTWVDYHALVQQLGNSRPGWAPHMLDDMPRWSDQMQRVSGTNGLFELESDSLRYGLLMRKYQIEAFRREVPYGGYVISVIRDTPKVSMGLFDYLGRPKWTEADWSWQRDTICLLKTEDDRRSFAAGKRLRGEILLSHFGSRPISGGQLGVAIENFGNPATPPLSHWEQKSIQQNPGTLSTLFSLDWPVPEVTAPIHLMIRAKLTTSEGEIQNEWPVWVVPATPPGALNAVQVHDSLDPGLAKELLPESSRFDRAHPNDVVVASRFDDDLVRYLENGGRVLLLPDGQKFSLPLNAHWFLCGAPFIPESALSGEVPRDFFIELQHFDLAADIVPDLPQIESFDPLLLLWDTHDQKTIKTHGILFETRVAKGRLLVSAAGHNGPNNAAGRWLLGVLLHHLRSAVSPKHALPDAVWDYLKARLHADQTNLVARTWQFMPDPNGDGLARGWHLPGLQSANDWKSIHIGDWWERQGYPNLDGWAWYRLWVEVPESWSGRDVFVSFEGVDDMYELYVNGELAGRGGDLATRKDALNEKKSHNVTRFVKPGQKALLAVRVYDWYGYGGIFRPVTLGTLPFNPALDLLR